MGKASSESVVDEMVEGVMGVLHDHDPPDVGKNGSSKYQTDNDYDLLTLINLDRELHFFAIFVQEKIGFVSTSLGYFEFILILL